MIRFRMALLGFAILIGSQGVAQAGWEKLYNRYNIHVATREGRGRPAHIASYANYTSPGPGHWIIPPNTELMVEIGRSGFTIRLEDKRTVVFEFQAVRMGMTVKEYLGKIMSAEPVDLSGYSELDRQGIKEGKALVGMSKAGVMAALGYPAAHRTPSLDESTYVYWTNRFSTVAVKFGADGRVDSIVD
jgi:hypothetical protein